MHFAKATSKIIQPNNGQQLFNLTNFGIGFVEFGRWIVSVGQAWRSLLDKSLFVNPAFGGVDLHDYYVMSDCHHN